MAVTDKYQSLIDLANQNGVSNLQIAQQGDVLYISGTTNSGDVKQQLWDEYNRLDPEYRSGDLVLNIEVEGSGYEEYTVQTGDSLSRIATHQGVNWKEIWDANRDEVKDPNLIHPGQPLRIPKS